MGKHIRNVSILVLIALFGIGYYMTRPDVATVPVEKLTGPTPEIGAPRQQSIPTVKVAEVDRWKAGEAPKPASTLCPMGMCWWQKPILRPVGWAESQASLPSGC
jgi:hypothetical protein